MLAAIFNYMPCNKHIIGHVMQVIACINDKIHVSHFPVKFPLRAHYISVFIPQYNGFYYTNYITNHMYPMMLMERWIVNPMSRLTIKIVPGPNQEMII